MNPKFTLKVGRPTNAALIGKLIFQKTTYLLCLFFALLVGDLAPNVQARTTLTATFPSKMVKTFNRKVKANLANLEGILVTESAAFAPCPGGSGIIGGKTFQDFNYNGLDDQVGAGLEGIGVYIIGCDNEGNSQSISSTTTDENGEYFFSGLTDGATYRIEFIVPDALSYLQSGFNGADSRTTVQFVTSPSCEANIGLANPADFCEEDPTLAIPCFVNGDPLASNSGSADEDALVSFKMSYEGGTPKPTSISLAEEIGATWGITYNKKTKTLLVAAFLKRHVGLGPLGLGGLYQVDLNGSKPVTTPYVDLNSIGVEVGTYPSNSIRGLSSNINLPSNDAQAFGEVGKKGLGGLCMSEDGNTLYIVSLTNKTLYSIDVSSGVPTSTDVQGFPIPDPGCSGGTYRPFAVRASNGQVYVGGVCDAEASGNKSDLRAIVHRLDGSIFTEVLNFSLDFTKGLASRSCEDDRGWFPWTNVLPEPCFLSGSTNNVIVHPTPQLTSLEFDSRGDLILGFTDRMGNQLGFLNYPPVGQDALYSVFTGGDILKAGKNADGSFTIENNGSAGGLSTAGVGNNEGPGGGEFYYMDVYDIAPGVPRPHHETAQGGLTSVKGSGQIITTALDPFGTFVNAGGVNYLDNQTGAIRDPGYVVFRSGSSSISTFAKANGLGDVVALCGEAPIEIGGRLWVDTNKNGIQDPCENPLLGIQVALYEADGAVIGTVETDVNGEYYFSGNPIQPNTTYYVRIGSSEQVDVATNALLDSFFLTDINIGMGVNPDLNDSDGLIASESILDGAIVGWPIIEVQTKGIGAVTHDNDAGFFASAPAPKASIRGFVWNDLNENGLQNEGSQAYLE